MSYKFKGYKKTELMRNHLNLGGANPYGERIDVTNLYIEKGEEPWIGVMGEFHFSRYDSKDWYKELCKMKAGGINVVATYLFWNYHEEFEGKFDFTGNLDIRKFVEDSKEAGLDLVLRIGPWAHGECRNGGFPDWLMNKPYELRDNNEEYMSKARIWYEKIFEQVQGLFYKDGGNIIFVQLENELTDKAEHLLALKKLALDVGYDAPIFTVTGWNRTSGAKIPVDDVLPVFAAYPEAPWADTIDVLPLSPHYVFDTMRNDTAVGLDLIAITDEDGWRLPYEKYPFATCELGAGIQVTHHRRPIINGMDAYALSLVKLGCGNNLVGYYMYHGGTHKIGQLSTLNETKASGYPNDYPILSYDFQAPLSEYGEVREQYRLLNLLHMFVKDFGNILAPMETVPSEAEVKRTDLSSLRYAMRTDGKGGFVFVNHYQRLARLKDLTGVVIDTGSVVFPMIDIRGDISFIMPFHLAMENNNILEYATAQLLCKENDTYFFVAIEGIEAEYKFMDGSVFNPKAGIDSVFEINGIKFVTLTWNQGRFFRKLDSGLYIGEDCDLYEIEGEIASAGDNSFAYYKWNGANFEQISFVKEFEPAVVTFTDMEKVPIIPTHSEELHIGGERQIKWMQVEVSSGQGMIEIPFPCDAAQIYADGVLIADQYYYGEAWRVPAKLLYRKICYLALSEMKNDFYREF